MALWDWEKVFSPENSPGGRRVEHPHSYKMSERLPEFLAGLNGEVLSLPKSIHKERNDYFFKRSDINVKLTKNPTKNKEYRGTK